MKQTKTFQKLAAEFPPNPSEISVESDVISEENANKILALANGELKIGVIRLRAGYENTREWFESSATKRHAVLEWGMQQQPPWNDPDLTFGALATALLGNDDRLVTEAAEITRRMGVVVSDEVPDKMAMALVVSCIATRLLDTSKFEQKVDNLRTTVDYHVDANNFRALDDDVTKRVVSYTQFMEGIRDGDQKAIADAIELMLEYHDEEVFDDPEEDHTSIDATMLTILARREGFDVDVESEYIPENLPNSGLSAY